jgi:hypothetical protein
MVVVISLAVADRLSALERIYRLDLPVPLSSSCASYFAPEQLDFIFSALRPLVTENSEVAKLLNDLKADQQSGNLPVPCQGQSA